jgi:hypothetical protein
MSDRTWTISGEYMESCNCDYLCPCINTNPQGPATYDDCRVAMAFRIDEGQCDGVDLAGLHMALLAKSKRVMAEGGWVYGGFVDERANEPQRAAIAAIIGGEAGGPPGMIVQNLVEDFQGVHVTPIEITIDGMTRAVSIPGMFSFAIQGVASRRSNGEPYYIDNVAHPAGSKLALATADGFNAGCFGIDVDLSGAGNNGHYARFSWAN